MLCPRDRGALINEQYEGDVLVDRCPSCDGVWLQRGELEAIQESLERDYSAELRGIDVVALAYERARQANRPDIACPSCGTALQAEEFGYCSQILVDRCGKCGGIWLDSGELKALERFFERETGVRKGFFASLLQRVR
jgi:Zn-finger nucleic acid-binding protein